MDDLVERLRGHSEIMERDKGKFVRFIDVATCIAAADALAAKDAEIAALRKALETIRIEAERENGSWIHLKRCIAVQARAALEKSNG